MNRKTLLFVAVLAALGAGTALAATQDAGAQKPARLQLDKNNDGAIDRSEAAGTRLAPHFDRLDKNSDGKLSADERPQFHGRHGQRGHGLRHGFAPAKLDADGDGRISRGEAAADARFAARFEQMDANKDGVIDRADREAKARQRRDEWFARADADKDGKLARTEIDRADAQRRAEFQQRMQARMDERFATIDANKDGRVSREEAKAHPRLAERFDALDANKDGALSKDELMARRGGRR